MAGIEAAGLILGAIPLVISGLEHYGQGVSTVKIMFNAQSEFKSLARRLTVESRIFKNTIELLLHDCLEDHLLTNLMADLGNADLWADPAIEKALQRKLQSSYGVYVETIESMEYTLTEFKQRLKLNDDGKGPFTADKKSFRDAYKRFQFGLKKSAYMDLIEEISKDNTALAKLSEQSSALEPARTSRRRLPNFSKIRTSASSIFTTLQRGLGSGCAGSHKASLYMKPIESEFDGKESSSVSENDLISFRVVLHHEFSVPKHSTTLWAIEEAEIRLLDSIIVSTAQMPPVLPIPARPAKGKKSLRFKEPEPAFKPAPSTPATQIQDLEEIIDLCASIQRLQAMQCDHCLGYLQDAHNARRHGVFWPRKRLVDKSSFESLSLDKLLAEQSQHPGVKLSVADSRCLALSLALGTLRLHDTAWLGKQWGRKDIILLKQNGKILADDPFVSTSLPNAKPIHLPSHGNQSFAHYAGVRNETLFALGVVLIELCLERPFDELVAPEDLAADGRKHPASDLMTATRLLDSVYDKAGVKYGDAARRCILCEFDHRKPSLEDDTFVRLVYDNVVVTLEEEVRHFLGRS